MKDVSLSTCNSIRGVHDTGIPVDQMGIPWEFHGNEMHRLNSWEWEREWGWWIGNGREMGIVVWKKFPLVALITFLASYFSTFFIAILRDLTVLWLTRELACLYFVADILSLDLHCTLLFY